MNWRGKSGGFRPQIGSRSVERLGEPVRGEQRDSARLAEMEEK